MGSAGICIAGPAKGQRGVVPTLRPAHYKTLIALFERDGFIFARQRGDHLVYVKPGVARPLVIPAYREVPVFSIKNLMSTAGMSREQYFELLQNL